MAKDYDLKYGMFLVDKKDKVNMLDLMDFYTKKYNDNLSDIDILNKFDLYRYYEQDENQIDIDNGYILVEKDDEDINFTKQVYILGPTFSEYLSVEVNVNYIDPTNLKIIVGKLFELMIDLDINC